MLPHNNYLSYQTLPQPSQYSFDLKVNVDLNSGKIGLGVPQNVQPIHPFSRKQQVPVVYTQPAHSHPQSPPHSFTAPSPTMVSSYPPVAYYPPQQTIRQNQHIYTSTHTGYPVQRSQTRHYSPTLKGRSAYDTYPDSSFSLNMERSLDAVNCVICDKPVNRQQFPAHLQQHKGRKKQYIKNEPLPRNQIAKQSSFAMRNQDNMDAVRDMYKPNARNSLSLDPRDSRMYTRSSKYESGHNSLSRQIEDTHSRIVYAPRDPSKIVSSSSSSNNSNGNFDFNYSKSSGYQQQNSRIIGQNQSNRAQPSPAQTKRVQASFQQPSISQPSFNQPSPSVSHIKEASQPSRSMQNLSKGISSRQQNRYMQKSKRSSKLLPSEISRKMEEQRMRASKLDESRHSNWGVQSRKTSNFNLSRSKHNNSRYSSSTSGFYQRNQTKSRLIRPDRTNILEDCDQSMIHHLKDLSRFSRDTHLGELNKQLKIQKIEQQSSSDDEYSIKPNPSMRMYASIPMNRSKRMQQSMSLGLNRTKLPRNYLAMQQFIQDPMYYSCYRSRHPRF